MDDSFCRKVVGRLSCPPAQPVPLHDCNSLSVVLVDVWPPSKDSCSSHHRAHMLAYYFVGHSITVPPHPREVKASMRSIEFIIYNNIVIVNSNSK